MADAVRGNDLRYPVVQDNAYGTWHAWRNQYWPAKYLIDARGHVRYWHFGEGERRDGGGHPPLLAEAGRPPGRRARAGSRGRAGRRRRHHAGDVPGLAARAQLRQSRPAAARRPDASAPARRRSTRTSSPSGASGSSSASAPSRGRRAAVEADVGARRVFLVLSSPGRPRRARVLVDGRPVPDALAGPDVRDGVAVIRRQRLYRLLDFGRVERHRIAIELERGLAGYAFTFG